MLSLASPGRRPNTCSWPRATGTRPRIMCSRVVLPDPLGPMTATMPPAGTVKVACDQMGRPPRTALTSVSSSARDVVASSDSDIERLPQCDELTVLPCLERGLPGRHGLGHGDDGYARPFGGRPELVRDGALRLGVVDQDVHAPATERGAEGIDVSGGWVRLVGGGSLIASGRFVHQAERLCLVVVDRFGGRVGLARRRSLDLGDQRGVRGDRGG